MNIQKKQKVQFADLIEFVAVAEHRNFTQAAARLGVSTPALSRTIRTVEDRLGLRLFNRTTRHVAPTPAGERLLVRLRPVMEKLQSALEEMNDYRDQPTGCLRLAIAPAACQLMGPMLARFAAQYPEIKIDITTDEGPVDLISGQLDAGIRFRDYVTDNMVAVPASGEIRRIVVGAPSYFRRHGTPRAPDELSQHNCIRLRAPSGGIEPWEFVRGDETFTVSVDGAFTVSDVELALHTASSGGGLLYVPESSAKAVIVSHSLEEILHGWMPGPSGGFVLYYPSRRHNPAALRCLADFLGHNLRTSGTTSGPHMRRLKVRTS